MKSSFHIFLILVLSVFFTGCQSVSHPKQAAVVPPVIVSEKPKTPEKSNSSDFDWEEAVGIPVSIVIITVAAAAVVAAYIFVPWNSNPPLVNPRSL